MGEMGNVYGSLGNNLLFRGGDAGNDSAIVLHSYGMSTRSVVRSSSNNDNHDYQSLNKDDSNTEMIEIDCGEMIGTSGVFEGKKNLSPLFFCFYCMYLPWTSSVNKKCNLQTIN